VIEMRGPLPKRGWDKGETAVETAITLAVLLALIFGVIQFGIALWQFNTMELAVEQAGRYVMINNASCGTSCAESQMETALSTYAGLLPSSGQTCTVTNGNITPPTTGNICVSASTTAGTPSTMTLTAVYSYNFFYPVKFVIGKSGLSTVTSQATFPLD
jgi:Flp pilus assembly protein TadG